MCAQLCYSRITHHATSTLGPHFKKIPLNEVCYKLQYPGGLFTNVDRMCDVANRLRLTSHARCDLFTKRVAKFASSPVARAICFVDNSRRRKCDLRSSHVRQLFATFRE